MKTGLIISVVGKSSRLSKYYFPKALLPLHNRAIINQIIEKWDADYTVIVCNDKNIDLIRRYTNNKHIYTVVEDPDGGSSFSIKAGLDVLRPFNIDQVYVNWCDTLPFNTKNLYGNFIMTSVDIPCRYNLNFGIYGVFGWKFKEIDYDLTKKNKEVDLMDVLPLELFREEVIQAFDIGDEQKYTSNLREVDNPIRPFNNIEINNGFVVKKCDNEKLKEAEVNWYKNMGDLSFVPKIYEYDPLKMERINGEPRHDKADGLYSLAKRIHSKKAPIESNYKDCYKIYIEKTLQRLGNVDYMFPFKEKFVVNGQICKNPINILNKVNIEKYVPALFKPIHGDLTTSNVLWDGKKPYVIDPRGIFGDSLLYGDPDYDIAKIHYSKTGWHLLNKGALVPEVISKNAFSIEEVDFYGDEKIDFLLSIIWLSVTDYVKDNTLSMLFAYLRGSLLLTKWSEIYNEKQNG